MTSIRFHSRRHVGIVLPASVLALATACATAPDSLDQSLALHETPPAAECSRLGDEIARTEQARSVALAQSDNAWKAIVPVVVLAIKASGVAAVHEADLKLAALKVQARHCEFS